MKGQQKVRNGAELDPSVRCRLQEAAELFCDQAVGIDRMLAKHGVAISVPKSQPSGSNYWKAKLAIVNESRETWSTIGRQSLGRYKTF
jgi:hypothetical protein